MAISIVYTDGDGQYNPAELINLLSADSSQDKIPGDVSSMPVDALNATTANSNYALDEDFSSLQAKYPVTNSAMPFKALSDSELPVGEGGGGPTTTQIWKTG